MTYVDGFVAAVPTANRELHREHAEAAAVVFKEHGALKVSNAGRTMCPRANLRPFPWRSSARTTRRSIFSWNSWPSRNVRDEGMKKVMADPRLQPDKNPMPFDGKRLIYGGFECSWRRERAEPHRHDTRATSAAISGTAVQSTKPKE